MLNPKIGQYLKASYPADIVDALTSAYSEVLRNYRIERWKPSELDAGHFVEAARRIVEHELFETTTPLIKSMGSFSPAVLSKYEAATGDESFRILIPRVLFSIYCIRNKRGVGHIASISPNKMDATFILNSTKWVLAELVRTVTASNPDDAHALTDGILERDLDLIWDDGESFMIMNNKLKTEQKILVILYKRDRYSIKELQSLIGYRNGTRFKSIVERVRLSNLIDIVQGSICKISPLGIREAERIIENT